MAPAKIVKRYANRKLYDTERSCYVTLDDISAMITAGDEVRVIDNKSGEDLTSVTLAQIIFETEKKKSFMPLGLLRDLIQNRGEQLQDFYRDRVERATRIPLEIKESAQKGVQGVKDKAEKLQRDLKDGIGGVIRKGEEQVRAPIENAKGLVSSSQKALDDLQRGVEQRIKGGVSILGRELQQLRDRLSELEARLEHAERQQQREASQPRDGT
jgi:polyhydroxyalkanoate synthesis repressor PhaR